MAVTMRGMTAADKDAVMAMMRVFYRSEAVWSNGSEEIFANDIDACVQGSPYVEGFVLESGEGDDRALAGYAMIAKSFSTEAGKPCIWIEDIYIQPAFRAKGIGKMFFAALFSRYTDVVFRLEVEKENQNAVALYQKCGFIEMPYQEMIKP